MVEQLFGSKTRVKLLQLFMSNPNRSFYVREITRKVDEQINSVRRELANLLSIGVITSDTSNNRLYYEVDQKFKFYEPLSQMFGNGQVNKRIPKKAHVASDDPNASLEDRIRGLGNVQLAILSGQFTRDDSSGVDLLLVGDINLTKLENFISELEASEKKEIRYVLFGEQDFAYRRQISDRFTVTLLESKIQVLIDRDALFAENPVENS
ncbi:transcriptional regulator [Candidatus Saccharibacteria bacterium]|nr:transcriptional regulator [Candidatus Saccharibacteria bacterium]